MYIFLEKKAELFANSGDPDQTPRSAASDLGLHCLLITFQRYPEYNGLRKWPYLDLRILSVHRTTGKYRICQQTGCTG